MHLGCAKLTTVASEVCNSHCMAGVVYLPAFVISCLLFLLLLCLCIVVIIAFIYVLLMKLTKYVVILHASALLQKVFTIRFAGLAGD